jgi:hypothetical protein
MGRPTVGPAPSIDARPIEPVWSSTLVGVGRVVKHG